MTPSHYLNQWWVIINQILYYSLDSNFSRNAHAITHWNVIEYHTFRITSTSARSKWVYDHEWSHFRNIFSVFVCLVGVGCVTLFVIHWVQCILTHWGRMMHICVSNLTIIGSDNGLLPGQCQAIIWTNAGTLLIGPQEQTSMKIQLKFIHARKSIWKCHLENGGHLVSASMC